MLHHDERDFFKEAVIFFRLILPEDPVTDVENCGKGQRRLCARVNMPVCLSVGVFVCPILLQLLS